MSQQSDDLLTALRDLRESVVVEAAPRIERWRAYIEQPLFAASANNLAHYLTFRHHELRGLQQELMRHGLSSLGRLEGRVLVTLKTVETALEALLSGRPPPPSDWPASREEFFLGETRLRENTHALLGGSPDSGIGHILVTLPTEAAREPDYMLEIARRGADVVRINCAHDDADVWGAMIANTHKAAEAVGRRIPVLMDIAGPKFRIGEVKRRPGERLATGDRFRLVRDASAFSNDLMIEAVCEPADVLRHLAVGTEVSFDDGRLSGIIDACQPDCVVVHVQRTQLKGFKLKPERGLTFPRAELHLDPLTPGDLTDLDFVASHADMVGYSFVQSADDINRMQDELASRRPDWQRLGIVAKIETALAVTNLPDIIVRAAGRQPFGVMIARGDLAVAIGFERLAEMQEEILWLCEAAHVPVIWATQVLEEMVKSGLPTRGEMTDAAMAARAECVMLNKGPKVGEAITALRGLLHRMMEHQSKKTSRLRALHSW
jgi:pyruvate kinase